MMYWVYDIPNWLFGLLTVCAFSLLSLAGLELVQRYRQRKPSSVETDRLNGFVSTFFGASVGLYGITLGLISVGAWQTFSDVDSKSGAEAASVAAFYRDVGAYPEPVRGRLRAGVKEYTRYVIQEAWPLQRKGHVPEGDTARIDVIQADLHSFEPKTEGQIANHQEALHQFNTLIEVRRRRLQTVTSGLPTSLWGVVLVGAFLSMSLTWLFSIESKRLHRVLVTIYASLVGTLIFLMGAMDNPYRGEFSVGPDAFQQVFEHLMK
jgi:predicted outer membrane lipoprotein